MRLWNEFNWLMGYLAGFCKEANERSGSVTENKEFSLSCNWSGRTEQAAESLTFVSCT